MFGAFFIENLFGSQQQQLFFGCVVFTVIISIVLHELAHGWAALWQGDDTPKQMGHMTADPLVHMGGMSLLVLALLGLFLPWTEALICSWQGWNALNGYRFKPALQAAFARALLYCALVYGLYFTPMLFILPAIVIGLQRKADSEWLPSGLTPALRQEWNRIQRTHSRRKAAAVRHRRSSASEEE